MGELEFSVQTWETRSARAKGEVARLRTENEVRPPLLDTPRLCSVCHAWGRVYVFRVSIVHPACLDLVYCTPTRTSSMQHEQMRSERVRQSSCRTYFVPAPRAVGR